MGDINQWKSCIFVIFVYPNIIILFYFFYFFFIFRFWAIWTTPSQTNNNAINTHLVIMRWNLSNAAVNLNEKNCQKHGMQQHIPIENWSRNCTGFPSSYTLPIHNNIYYYIIYYSGSNNLNRKRVVNDLFVAKNESRKYRVLLFVHQ